MLLKAMMIADAYGMAFEFVDREKWPGVNDGKTFYPNPNFAEYKKGRMTDDSFRATANYGAMSCGPYNIVSYTGSYGGLYLQYDIQGFSRGFKKVMEASFEQCILHLLVNRNSTSNGAVMGVMPLGYLKDFREVKTAAMVQALSTHGPETCIHAQVVALISYYFINAGKLSDLVQFLDLHVDYPKGVTTRTFYDLNKTTPVTMEARDTVSALLTGLFSGRKTLTELMVWAVDLTGDTDSAAAVLVGTASLSDEFIDDFDYDMFKSQMDEETIRYYDEFLKEEQFYLDRYRK